MASKLEVWNWKTVCVSEACLTCQKVTVLLLETA